MIKYEGSFREDQDIEKKLRFKGATAVNSYIEADKTIEAPIINQLKIDQAQIDRVIVPEVLQPPKTVYSAPTTTQIKHTVKPLAYSVISQKVPIYSFAKSGTVKKGLVDSIEAETPKETNIILFVMIGVGVLGVFFLLK